MVDNSQGIKKSKFPATTTVASTDTFDLINGNTNKKITFANLITALGVLGTIQQQGAATGTPVLDPDGSVKNIRNLENGAGVKASVSPQDGITLDLNLTVDQTGVPLLLNTTDTTPDLVSIVASTGISATAVLNTIVLTSSGAQVIREISTTYQVLVGDDIINCIGTFTVTLPNILNAVKEVTISSTSGTITVAGDATIEPPASVPTGASITFYPARGQWWQK